MLNIQRIKQLYYILSLGGPGSPKLLFGYVPGTGVSVFDSPLVVLGLSYVSLIVFIKLCDSSLVWVSVQPYMGLL